MKVTVQITQEHIDKGKQHDYLRCALALALQSVKLPVSQVGGLKVYWKNGESSYWPGEVIRFIRDFDWKRSACRPISFKLDVPLEH